MKTTIKPQLAHYQSTYISRFDGNPCIEALPPLPKKKLDFSLLVERYPVKPSSEVMNAGEVVRLMESQNIKDVVFPLSGYAKVALSVSTLIREAYVGRNPLSSTDVRRRHTLAVAKDMSEEVQGELASVGWESTAGAHLLVAVSGMGKTTFANEFLQNYDQVIQHEEYKGVPLKHTQLVYLKLRVPHDGSMKGLCLQFFYEIDRLLGTNYLKEARFVGTVNAMSMLIHKVATAVSLGLVVIDEFQNLRAARGGSAEHLKNFIGEIVEWAGVSVLIIATPAVQHVISGSLGNARKMSSSGDTFIEPMKLGESWRQFCETLWEYYYLEKKVPLTDDILQAWHRASGGVSSFAKLAYMLATRKEIGGREYIDAASFDLVANTELVFLKPAIRALASNTDEALKAFDDLFISKKFKELRAQLGLQEQETDPKRFSKEEFSEMTSKTQDGKKKGRRKAKSAAEADIKEIDPLILGL